MRALVTGVSGFIGSQLAERLLSRGDAVRGVDRFSEFYEPEVKRRNLAALEGEDRFELIEADLNELDLTASLEGIDVVFHLAAQPGVRVSWGDGFQVYLADNVLATQRILEAARASAVGRVVLASSSSVYGAAERYPVSESDPLRPRSPYGATKLAAEQLALVYWREFGVPTVALRYFTIFGPRQRPDMAFSRFIAAALGDGVVEIYGDGEQRRDFTFVEDALDATITAAEAGEPGAAYNVAGGADASVAEAIVTLSGLLDREFEIRRLPVVPGDVRVTSADTTRARAELGFKPRIGLEAGLARQVEAALERGRA